MEQTKTPSQESMMKNHRYFRGLMLIVMATIGLSATLIILLNLGSPKAILLNFNDDGSLKDDRSIPALYTHSQKDNSLVSGDFDGDKLEDLMVIEESNDKASMYRQDSEELSFVKELSFDFGLNRTTGDYDGDGKDEIMAVNGNTVSIINYEDSGELQACAVSTISSASDAKLISGDFNGDAKTDVMTYINDESSEDVYFSTTVDGCNVVFEKFNGGPLIAGENVRTTVGKYNLDKFDDIMVFTSDSKPYVLTGGQSKTEVVENSEESRDNSFETVGLFNKVEVVNVLTSASYLVSGNFNSQAPEDVAFYDPSVGKITVSYNIMEVESSKNMTEYELPENGRVLTLEDNRKIVDETNQNYSVSKILYLRYFDADDISVNAGTGTSPTVNIAIPTWDGKYKASYPTTTMTATAEAGQKYVAGDFDGDGASDVFRYGPGTLADTTFMAQKAVGRKLAPRTVARIKVGNDKAIHFGSVTITEPEADGYAVIYACDTTQPATSTINFVKGQTVSNYVVSQSDTTGNLCINSSARVHYLWDTNGSLPVNTVDLQAPMRKIDTRLPANSLIKAKLPVNAVTKVTIGRANTTHIANLTAVNANAVGHISVYPCTNSTGGNVSRPTTSVLNFVPGKAVASMVVAKADVNGQVCIYSSTGTHLIWDELGEGGALPSEIPRRVVDTRNRSGTLRSGILNANENSILKIGTSAQTIAGTITAVTPESNGFISIYPCSLSETTASTSQLSFVAGESIATGFFARSDASGSLCVKSSARTHLLLDISSTSNLSLTAPSRVIDSRSAVGTGPVTFVAKNVANSVNSINESNYLPIVGDYNGDGKDEIYWYMPGEAQDYHWVYDSLLGNLNYCQPSPVNVKETVYRPVAGDFNGDGTDDIFWLAPGNDKASYIWYMTPAKDKLCGFLGINPVEVPAQGMQSVAVSDLNADKLMDVILYDGGKNVKIWPGRKVALGQSHLANPIAQTALGQTLMTGGDMNGDGYGDITWYNKDSTSSPVWLGSANFINGSTTIELTSGGDILSGSFYTDENGFARDSYLFISEPYSSVLNTPYQPAPVTPTSGVSGDFKIEMYDCWGEGKYGRINPTGVTIHYTAIPNARSVPVSNLCSSMSNSGVSVQFYVDGNSRIWQMTNDPTVLTGHNWKANQYNIGIEIAASNEAELLADPNQHQATLYLVKYLLQKYNIGVDYNNPPCIRPAGTNYYLVPSLYEQWYLSEPARGLNAHYENACLTGTALDVGYYKDRTDPGVTYMNKLRTDLKAAGFR